jgi:hypothetical protein
MKRTGLVITLFLVGMACAAEPAPVGSPEPNTADLQATVKKQGAAIKCLQAKMVELRKELKAQQKENARLIKLCQRAGVYTGKPGRRFPRPLRGANGQLQRLTKVELGASGWVGSVTAEQIIDANNMIVKLSVGVSRVNPRLRGKTAVVTRPGLVSPKGLAMEGYPVYHTKTVWLKGINTTGLADNGGIDLNCLCHITGTKSYTTVTGAQRTIFVMEPVGGDGSKR